MRITRAIERAAICGAANRAIIDGPVTRRWGEVADRVARAGQAIAALPVAPGEHIGVLATNAETFFTLDFAIPWAGAVAVPLNTRLTSMELAFQLKDAGVTTLFYSREFAATAAGLKEQGAVRRTIAMDEPDAGADDDLAAMISRGRPVDPAPLGDHDLAAIYYTGGTTGLPKGVMLSHANLYAMAANLLMAIPFDETCTVFHAAPMFHLADIATVFATMTASTHVFRRTFDAPDMLRAFAEHGVTHCFTVPAVIERLASDPLGAELDLSALRVLGYGGAPMPAASLDAARARFPHVDFVQGFGQTEMAAATFLSPRWHRAGAPADKLRSCGQACPGYDLRIFDESGREALRGTVGEIVGRGGNVMMGYWNRPDETAEVMKDGWLHTRDLGYMDEDGFIYITDRAKDMIISGAENVYSIEVENALSYHPGVAESAVIGVPDAKWGERVHAVIVPRAGVTLDIDEVIAFCRTRIAGYKCPKTVALRAEPLPRSAAGKVLKGPLRKEHGQGATA